MSSILLLNNTVDPSGDPSHLGQKAADMDLEPNGLNYGYLNGTFNSYQPTIEALHLGTYLPGTAYTSLVGQLHSWADGGADGLTE